MCCTFIFTDEAVKTCLFPIAQAILGVFRLSLAVRYDPLSDASPLRTGEVRHILPMLTFLLAPLHSFGEG